MKTSKMLVATFLITIFLTSTIFAFSTISPGGVSFKKMKKKVCYGKIGSNGEYKSVRCGKAKGWKPIGGKCSGVGACRKYLYTKPIIK